MVRIVSVAVISHFSLECLKFLEPDANITTDSHATQINAV